MSGRDLFTQWPHLAPEVRATIVEKVRGGLEALRVPEPLTLSQWAAKHFYLSAESSQQEGRWTAYPYQVGLLDCMGDENIAEFDQQKSARTGYTKILLALIGYTAQHKRRNQAVWQPTDDDSDDFCKTEVETMLRDVKIMRTVFPRQLANSKINTLQQKKFLGSVLKLRGGKAAGNYRRLTIAVAIADELDGFDQQVEKSSDPPTLIIKRLEGASFPMFRAGTTPRIKGFSHIERRMLAANIRIRYNIVCPHCDAEHPLLRGGKKDKHGLKWDKHDPEGTVRHVCPHCHGSITQADYLRIWHVGAWVSECGNYRLEQDLSDPLHPRTWWTTGEGVPCLPPSHVGAYVWTAYSPQATWASIARDTVSAAAKYKQGDSGPMQGVVNETYGETWTDEVDSAEAHVLQNRASKWPMLVVPHGGLVLCAGVDVQDDRFEIILWAFGRGEEMFAVGYIVIDANPADERDWARLWERLQTPLRHANGPEMPIHAAGVDTGGHFTHQAYSFVHQYQARSNMRLFALKGSSKQGEPIKGTAKPTDINHKGRIIKRGVKLWMVGTDTAKDLFFGRLKVTQPGPGFVHFNGGKLPDKSDGLPRAFYDGLTSEVRAKAKTASGDVFRWVKQGGRNEPLDGTVYAIFCSHVLDVHRFEEYQWRRYEARVAPSLFDIAMEPEPAVEAETPQASTPAAPIAIKKEAPPAPPPPRSAPRAPAPNPFASSDWMQRL